MNTDQFPKRKLFVHLHTAVLRRHSKVKSFCRLRSRKYIEILKWKEAPIITVVKASIQTVSTKCQRKDDKHLSAVHRLRTGSTSCGGRGRSRGRDEAKEKARLSGSRAPPAGWTGQ